MVAQWTRGNEVDETVEQPVSRFHAECSVGRCVLVWRQCRVTRIQEVQNVYSYVWEFTIVEECGSQEEFGDEADSCSKVNLQHTGVFIVIYSTVWM